MIRNPQQSVGCWIMKKQVTSNITHLSLAESLEKWLGRQVLASFSLIRSSILVIKKLHLRWTGANMGPFLFLGLLKYHLLDFHAEEHLPVLCKSVYRIPETHQEVVCRVPVLTSIAHWLHQIKFLPFSLHHRFLHWALSTPRPRPSLSRRPRRLRWCWCEYWIVSRRAFSNEIIVITSTAVFFRICWFPIKFLDWNCRLLSIFLAFEVLSKRKVTSSTTSIDTPFCWEINQELRIYLHSFCWFLQGSCPWDVSICSSNFCL